MSPSSVSYGLGDMPAAQCCVTLHQPSLLPPPPDPAEHLKLQVVPSSTLVKEGDDVKLVCEADGNPAPVFSFLKREVRLEGTWVDILCPGCSLSPAWRALGNGMQWLEWRMPVRG